MKIPLSIGWVSARKIDPFVVIADAEGYAIAQALGRTPEEALEHARAIVYAVNETLTGRV